MTTRREVPFSGDVTAWVHNELAELKSKLAIAQQAAEQSRHLAADASDASNAARMRFDVIDAQSGAIQHLQDDLRSLADMIVRTQDDIHSLRQSREEMERRNLAEQERIRQDRNEVAHHFGDIERSVEGWREQLTSAEEHNRRNLELATQLGMRIDAIQTAQQESVTLHSRAQTSLARIDQELQRLSATVLVLQRADEEQRERSSSALEAMRRIESEIEVVRQESNRYSRLDDRLELVQAERTRHNERLNELSGQLVKVDERLVDLTEKDTLITARIASYQDDVRGLNGKLQDSLDQVANYLHSVAAVEADMRKRQIIALEKEIRDVRSRALNFNEQ